MVTKAPFRVNAVIAFSDDNGAGVVPLPLHPIMPVSNKAVSMSNADTFFMVFSLHPSWYRAPISFGRAIFLSRPPVDNADYTFLFCFVNKK
jgi:hypothetical protein